MRLLRNLMILIALVGAGLGLSATAQAAPLTSAAAVGQVGAENGLTTQVRFRRYGYRYGYRRPFFRRRYYGYRRPFYRRPYYRRRFYY